MKFLVIFALVAYSQFASAQALKPQMTKAEIKKSQAVILSKLGAYPEFLTPWRTESERKVKLERVVVTPSANRIHLYFNAPLGQISIREQTVKSWEGLVIKQLGRGYEGCKVQLYCRDTPIERLVPNLYRTTLARDQARTATPSKAQPLVQNIDQPTHAKGLSGRHIALWPSHGKYYDEATRSWIWQRPALFGSIEDLNSFEYAYRYLIPMLESAGAVVVSPREMDPNPTEIIVDDTQATIVSGDWSVFKGGFQRTEILHDENPFELGSRLVTNNGGTVRYDINAPRSEYAVTVSYQSSSRSSTVEYVVAHAGGTTRYRVNQKMGSGWIKLGTHTFDGPSSVTVIATGAASTDAIRLGGGMGSVVRGSTASGEARWAEGARYFLQYSGAPASIYAQTTLETEESSDEKELKHSIDYYDDYKCRGNWSAWIQNQHHVPLDAVVALHTNAGIVDTIFGTLTINYTDKFKGRYSNSSSKLAGRDLADIVMTQIVSDTRAKYNPNWTRRSMYDKGYHEVLSPDAPAIIIELLSHQNFNDMKYGLDPAFRFDASRAIYKGILRFMADRYSVPYVVQPLAPTAFAMGVEGSNLVLTWDEQPDPLEPTATATGYRLYTRVGDRGFDNGVAIVSGCTLTLPRVIDGVVRSYKITAVNDGGESFATPILSACFLPSSDKLALVIDGCSRRHLPAVVDGGFDLANFANREHDFGIVGTQHNFDPHSEFVDNEHPGWGASTTEVAAIGRLGYDVDHTLARGREMIARGYSYISTSVGMPTTVGSGTPDSDPERGAAFSRFPAGSETPRSQELLRRFSFITLVKE